MLRFFAGVAASFLLLTGAFLLGSRAPSNRRAYRRHRRREAPAPRCSRRSHSRLPKPVQ